MNFVSVPTSAIVDFKNRWHIKIYGGVKRTHKKEEIEDHSS